MRPSPPSQNAPHHTLRLLSVIAATLIALSCGTNYAYSAWAPQFASRLHLSATQQNLIGNFGNIGMYAMGIPGGILIDRRGPRWGVCAGVVALAVGYFGLRGAFVKGVGEDGGSGSGSGGREAGTSIYALCLFSLLTGMGSCTAFSAAIKVSATNWPRHRGTATAFPLSAFGLSAFFYTTASAFLFPDDTEGYLLLLAVGTTVMVFVGMFGLQIVRSIGHGAGYQAVSGEEDRPGIGERRDSNKMIRTHSGSKGDDGEAGTTDEHSSLVSSSPSTTGPGDLDIPSKHPHANHPPPTPEITGLQLFRTPTFWLLFLLLGLLCGVGLMTINNIGNTARALWRHYDDSTTPSFIQKRQLMHVSILSLCSFVGRLSSGIGSDALVHRGKSRFWTLVVSGSLFTAAQIVALVLTNPQNLFLLSGLTGLAYGALFGVYPALVADAFGPSGLGINWGAMTMAPVLSGNFFNLAYGGILDAHSQVVGKERVCTEGAECYRSAYWVTLVASVVGTAWAVGCIWREAVGKRRRGSGWGVEGREHEG